MDIQTRGVFIRDLDSTNGTFVNGILVRDGQVNPGDRIELGPYMFTLNREAVGVRLRKTQDRDATRPCLFCKHASRVS